MNGIYGHANGHHQGGSSTDLEHQIQLISWAFVLETKGFSVMPKSIHQSDQFVEYWNKYFSTSSGVEQFEVPVKHLNLSFTSGKSSRRFTGDQCLLLKAPRKKGRAREARAQVQRAGHAGQAFGCSELHELVVLNGFKVLIRSVMGAQPRSIWVQM